jgi:phosphatidylglycerophosphate synthase
MWLQPNTAALSPDEPQHISAAHLIAMPTGTEAVLLFGLTPTERLQRQLVLAERAARKTLAQQRRGKKAIFSQQPTLPQGTLIAWDDLVLDDRLLQVLTAQRCAALRTTDGLQALWVPHEQASLAKAILAGQQPLAALEDCQIISPDTLADTYSKKLRRADVPLCLRVHAVGLDQAERALFAAVYKGMTDLVTKWVWPKPAFWLTRWAAHRGIRPNQVTLVGAACMLSAGVGFWHGHFGWALVTAWMMSLLDTVDGKLARVTATSSRFGHVLDHGMDIVHPPFWYLAWAVGLEGLSWHWPILGVVFAGYVLGRLAEGVFSALAWPCSLFTWKPWTSVLRLVTARRNPNLILLSAAALVGTPEFGLIAVAAWTAITTAALWWATGQAIWRHMRGEAIVPWLTRQDRHASTSIPAWMARLLDIQSV